MNNINDGGAAFPRPYSQDEYAAQKGDRAFAQEGMTLRDYFAGQALAGITTHIQPSIGPRMDTEKLCEACADYSYMIADAMLAAREGGGK